MRSVTRFLYQARAIPTNSIQDCHTIARVLEGDLFYCASSLEDFKSIDGKRVTEANRKACIGTNPEMVDTAFMKPLSNRYPLGFCSTKKQPDIVVTQNKQGYPKYVVYIFLFSTHVLCGEYKVDRRLVMKKL